MNQLQPILEKLKAKIPVDSIYAFHYAFLGEKKIRLLVVIDSKSQVAAKTLEPMAQHCLAETPQYSFELIPYGELKTAIKNGSLYYTLACQKENRRLALGKKPLPVLSLKDLELIRAKAREHFEKGRIKQEDFLEGMTFYREKGNYPQALFMLHQAAELTFRGMENALFKRDRPSHGLQEHCKLIAKYIPELGCLFPKEDPYYFRLLKLIDQSYTAVRYQRNFEVEPEELENLEKRLLPILKWCSDYYNSCMETLDQLIAQPPAPIREIGYKSPLEAKIPERVKISLPNKLIDQLSAEQQQALKTVLANLFDAHPIKELFLLGTEIKACRQNGFYEASTGIHHTAHFHLLAVYAKGYQARSHTVAHPEVKATVLMIAENNVTDGLKKKNRFIIQALTEGILLYPDNITDSDLQIPKQDWSLVLEKSRAVWAQRGRLAEEFCEAALWSNRDVDSRHAALLLLSQSLEQACVGLLYVSIGCRVDNYHLPFLLDVCKLVAPELSTCLGTHTELDKQLMQWLNNCLVFLRYKKEFAPGYEEVDYLIQRVKAFISMADKHCRKKLALIESWIPQQEPEVIIEKT